MPGRLSRRSGLVAGQASAGQKYPRATGPGIVLPLPPARGSSQLARAIILSAYYSAVQADLPIAWWRLGDTGTTAYDQMRQSDGTYTNAPTRGVVGPLNNDPSTAATFAKASNQYVHIPDVASLRFAVGSACSVELWFKLAASQSGSACLFDIDVNGGPFVQVNGPGTGYFTWLPDGGAIGANSSVGIGDTNWHHGVFTVDVSSNYRIYIDGLDRTDVAGTPAFGWAGASNGLNIAAGDTVPTQPFDGSLAEVALYNYALTPTQVANHYTAAVTPPPPLPPSPPYRDVIMLDAPQLYWRLGEISGTTAVNAANPGTNNGTYTGSPTLGVASTCGDNDKAISISGAGTQYVTQGTFVLSNAAWSIEAWSKGTYVGTDSGLAGQWNGVGGAFLYLNGFATNAVSLSVGSVTDFNSIQASLRNGNWHHIVGTFDGVNARIYYDGALAAGPRSVTMTTAAVPFEVGNYNNHGSTNNFDGSVDEVAVYNYALTPAQVAAHFAAFTVAPRFGIFRKQQQAIVRASVW